MPELAWIRRLRDECVTAMAETGNFATEVAALRYTQLYCQWREMLCAAVHDAQHDAPGAGASELRAALLGELVQSIATLVDETIVRDAQQLAGRILGAGFTAPA